LDLAGQPAEPQLGKDGHGMTAIAKLRLKWRFHRFMLRHSHAYKTQAALALTAAAAKEFPHLTEAQIKASSYAFLDDICNGVETYKSVCGG
jgi:hypothetical protein